MKKLQNNYTTPEQSKRLLELGVPADSANCYLTRFGIDEDWEVKVLNNVKYSEIAISNQEYCLPCWSVGRLIEILMLCYTKWIFGEDVGGITCSRRNYKDGICTELFITMCASIRDNELDFSKLEE